MICKIVFVLVVVLLIFVLVDECGFEFSVYIGI